MDAPANASAATFWTDGATIDVRAGFCANAPAAIVVTLGSVKDVIRVFWNAWDAIVKRDVGRVTLVKLEQFKNMPLGRVKIEPSKVTEVRSSQPLNTDAPNTVIPL